MRLVWAVIPLVLIGIGVQDSYSEKVIGIRGLIFENGTTILDPWYRIEGRTDIPLDNSGDVRIQYYDINDEKIAETGFNYVPTCLVNGEMHCFDFMGFALRIPDIGDFKKIVLLHDNQILSEKVVSPNPPEVKITYPNGGEVFKKDESITIRWESSDLDGDDLTFLIQISYDGGNKWHTTSLDVPTNEFEFKFYYYVSDSVLIRVTANDGINTTSDASDETFTVIDSSLPIKQAKNEIKTIPVSPKKQLSQGITFWEITCKSGLELIYKNNDASPTCVKEESKIVLMERGWSAKNPFLILMLDKTEYQKNDFIQIHLQNISDKTLTFSDSNYGTSFSSSDGDKHCCGGYTMMTALKPYQDVMFSLPVFETGNYTLTTSGTVGNTSESLVVTKNFTVIEKALNQGIKDGVTTSQYICEQEKDCP